MFWNERRKMIKGQIFRKAWNQGRSIRPFHFLFLTFWPLHWLELVAESGLYVAAHSFRPGEKNKRRFKAFFFFLYCSGHMSHGAPGWDSTNDLLSQVCFSSNNKKSKNQPSRSEVNVDTKCILMSNHSELHKQKFVKVLAREGWKQPPLSLNNSTEGRWRHNLDPLYQCAGAPGVSRTHDHNDLMNTHHVVYERVSCWRPWTTLINEACSLWWPSAVLL